MNKQEYDAIRNNVCKIESFISRWEEKKEYELQRIANKVSGIFNKLTVDSPPLEGCQYSELSRKNYTTGKARFDYEEINFYTDTNTRKRMISVYTWDNYERCQNQFLMRFPESFLWDDDLDNKIAQSLAEVAEKKRLLDEEKQRKQDEKDKEEFLRLKEKFANG